MPAPELLAPRMSAEQFQDYVWEQVQGFRAAQAKQIECLIVATSENGESGGQAGARVAAVSGKLPACALRRDIDKRFKIRSDYIKNPKTTYPKSTRANRPSGSSSPKGEYQVNMIRAGEQWIT